MTVGELHHHLEVAIESGKEHDKVVVRMSEVGIPHAPMVPVERVGIGFDWTMGMFIIHPNQPVIRKPKTE